ncbi:MAG: RNA polymerase sigma factor [Chitinophagaceae bacterium]|nr:RNA polymerase sigma factor [Chitinophagaceae bacterium]
MTEQEYNNCVKEHADSVYRFILKNLRNREDARDVVQTAFEKMWTNRATVDGSRSKSFLFTVAYHQMIDHIRKSKVVMMIEDTIADVPVYSHRDGDTKKILENALARLNETQRSLVLLKDYEGYSYEEIGEITGLSASQVKVYLHRARIQLKNYLVSPENILEQ